MKLVIGLGGLGAVRVILGKLLYLPYDEVTSLVIRTLKQAPR
jgi:hypothetical protein